MLFRKYLTSFTLLIISILLIAIGSSKAYAEYDSFTYSLDVDNRDVSFIHMTTPNATQTWYYYLASIFDDGTIAVGSEAYQKVSSTYKNRGLILLPDMPVSFYEPLQLYDLSVTGTVNSYTNINWRMQNVTNLTNLQVALHDSGGTTSNLTIPLKDNSFKMYIEMTDEDGTKASFAMVNEDGQFVETPLRSARVAEEKRFLKLISGTFTNKMKKNVENSMIGRGCSADGVLNTMNIRNVTNVNNAYVNSTNENHAVNLSDINLEAIRTYYRNINYNQIHFNSYRTFFVKENVALPDGSHKDLVISLDAIFKANCNGCLVYSVSDVFFANMACADLEKTTSGWQNTLPESSVNVHFRGTDNNISYDTTLTLDDQGKANQKVILPLENSTQHSFAVTEDSVSNEDTSVKSATLTMKPEDIVYGVDDYIIWVGRVTPAGSSTSGNYVDNPKITLSNDYSVKLKYTIRSGDENGISISKTDYLLDYSQLIGSSNIPNVTTSNGWEIEGYYIDGVKKTPEQIASMTITKDTVVEIRGIIPVHFVDGQTSSEIKTDKLTYNTTPTPPTPPSHTGYTFDKWDKTIVPLTEETTYTALYRANDYIIKFDKNADDATGTMTDQQMKYDVAADLNANAFTRTGYDFLGWNTARDASGNNYSDKQNVKNLVATDGGTITMYAKWQKKLVGVTLTKVDRDERLVVLSGASFHLAGTDIAGVSVTKDATSKADGRIEFGDLAYGIYTITEANPPIGYLPETRAWNLIISEHGTSVSHDSGLVDGMKLLNIKGNPSLDIVKTVTPTTASPGQVVKFSIVVTNTGNVTLQNVQLSDEMLGINKVIATSLAPGESASTVQADYTITQADAVAGRVNNTATTTATPPAGMPTPTKNATATVSVESHPKISLTKTPASNSLEQASAGDPVSWTLTVENKGDVNLTSLSLEDALAQNRSAIPAIPVEVLQPGQSFSLQITTPLAQTDIDSGTLTNEASIQGLSNTGVTVRDNASAMVTLPRNPQLQISKTVDKAEAGIGETLTYTITVKNTGNTTLNNVLVKDEILGYQSTVIAEHLAPNEEKKVDATLTHVVTQADALAGKFVNTAYATATDPSGQQLPEQSAEAATTINANSKLALTKTVEPSVIENTAEEHSVKWTFEVENTGDTDLDSVTISDPLLAERQISIPDIGTLPAGEKRSVSVDMDLVQADIDAGKVVNTASATGKFGDQSYSSPEAEAIVQIKQTASFDITKNVDKADAQMGDVLNYTLSFTNTGNTVLSDIKVDDQLLGITAKPVAEKVQPGQTITVELGSLTARQDLVSNGILTNTVIVSATPPTGMQQLDPKSAVASTRIQDESGIASSGDGGLIIPMFVMGAAIVSIAIIAMARSVRRRKR